MAKKIIYTLETDIVRIDVCQDLSCQVTKLATGQQTRGRLHFRGHELYCIMVNDFYVFKSSSIGVPGSKRMKNLQNYIEDVVDTPRTKFKKLCQAASNVGFHYRFVNEEEFEDGIGATVGHNFVKNPPDSGKPYVVWYTENQVKKEVGL